MKIYKSNSVEDTASAAGELAAELKPGDVIALVGDLGAGKTAFVKGIAKYFHSKNDVLSPTYTLVNDTAVIFQYIILTYTVSPTPRLMNATGLMSICLAMV